MGEGEVKSLHLFDPIPGLGFRVQKLEFKRILPGVHIGDGAVIGANSVVGKDIPPYAIAVGNPIQIKRYRFDEETINLLLELKWWDRSIEEIKKLIPLLDADLCESKEELKKLVNLK